MEEDFALDVLPLDDRYLKQVFGMEVGPDVDYYDWLEVVTRPDWLRYGLFLDDKFAGFLGVQKINGNTASLHVSIKPHTLRPKQTRKVMIETGIYLFNEGIETLETVHLMTNKPACRLANVCGMELDHLLIRHNLPHCVHNLQRQAYLDNPQRWEI